MNPSDYLFTGLKILSIHNLTKQQDSYYDYIVIYETEDGRRYSSKAKLGVNLTKVVSDEVEV